MKKIYASLHDTIPYNPTTGHGVYVCIYIYIFVGVCVYVCMYIYVCVYVCMYIHMYVYVCMGICLYTDINIPTHY